MVVRIVREYPALFIPKKKILTIADLHLGIEHELYKSGILIPPQAEKFKKIIDFLIKITRAKTLVILGDIKHKVPGISFREMREIPKLFSYLVKKIRVICVKGNHDDNIESLLPKDVEIYSSRGFSIDKYGFFHGHALPSKGLMKCNFLFTAHIHPLIEFKDSFGYRIVEQVWIKTKINENIAKEKYKIKKIGKLEVIIFPSF
ncbi:MAG: metallophosphoesterase, partial [Candidatus Aenigmatarchaeota archaeon]